MLENCNWLCEYADAVNGSWMSDAPWVKANERYGHKSTIHHIGGVAQIFDSMVWTTRGNRLKQLFYGNNYNDVKELSGFSCRYSTMDKSKAQNAINVIDAGGRDKLSSIWLVMWSPYGAFMITPDGIPPIAGSEMGLAISDWRFVYRIANVTKDISIVDLVRMLHVAVLSLPAFSVSRPDYYRPVIYMRPEIRNEFDEGHFRDVLIRPLDELSDDEQRVE